MITAELQNFYSFLIYNFNIFIGVSPSSVILKCIDLPNWFAHTLTQLFQNRIFRRQITLPCRFLIWLCLRLPNRKFCVRTLQKVSPQNERNIFIFILKNIKYKGPLGETKTSDRIWSGSCVLIANAFTFIDIGTVNSNSVVFDADNNILSFLSTNLSSSTNFFVQTLIPSGRSNSYEFM